MKKKSKQVAVVVEEEDDEPAKPLRNRVKKIIKVNGKDLMANPKNWRVHSDAQKRTLNGALNEVGIAGVLLAYETKNGLVLLDGHARVELHPDEQWNVAVLDVTPKEADYILATHDSITMLADFDTENLSALLCGLDAQDENIQEMLRSLAETAGIDVNNLFASATLPAMEDADLAMSGDKNTFKEVNETLPTEHKCPKCGYSWSGSK